MSTEPTMETLLEDESGASTGSHFSHLRRTNTMPVRQTSNGLRRSKSRQFSRSSTDGSHLEQSFLPPINENPKEAHDDATGWHAFALVFVALPAIAGLFFENGGAIMTDMLMLALGCLFLYWSVKWPWQWYHTSQGRIFVDFDSDYLEDEDMELVDTTIATDTEGHGVPSDGTETTRPAGRDPTISSSQLRRQKRANESLKSYELLALSTCFLMPIGVAYLLHAIRPYLSRPSGGLVSNSNLTLFVLAAEVRPFLHVFEIIHKRTIHLQKVVSAPPQHQEESPNHEQLAELLDRIEHLESTLASLPPPPPPAPAKGKESSSETETKEKESSTAQTEALISSATQSLQPQLDALNRAVRRYEKRAAMQAVILDARLRDLDAGINDAVALAAGASRMAQQRPAGLVPWAYESTTTAVSKTVHSVLVLPLLPYRVAQQVYVFLFGGKQKRRKGRKGEMEKGKKSIM